MVSSFLLPTDRLQPSMFSYCNPVSGQCSTAPVSLGGPCEFDSQCEGIIRCSAYTFHPERRRVKRLTGHYRTSAGTPFGSETESKVCGGDGTLTLILSSRLAHRQRRNRLQSVRKAHCS